MEIEKPLDPFTGYFIIIIFVVVPIFILLIFFRIKFVRPKQMSVLAKKHGLKYSQQDGSLDEIDPYGEKRNIIEGFVGGKKVLMYDLISYGGSGPGLSGVQTHSTKVFIDGIDRDQASKVYVEILSPIKDLDKILANLSKER